VTHPFVSNLRAELFPDATGNDYQLRQGADGRTINVANIGSTKKPPRYPVNGGLYYPVDFEHRAIYNDPRHTAEEIEPPYKAYLANDLLTLDQLRDFRFIDSAPKPTTYTCDDCGKKADTVVVDFKTHKQRCASCLEKHETEQKQQLEEQRRAAIPPAARLHDMDVLIGRDGLTVGVVARWRYSPGMAAACRHCLRLYHGEESASVHTDWSYTEKPGIWKCPKGHRLADHLLKIVAPAPTSEVATEAISPNPTPVEASSTSPTSSESILPQMPDDESDDDSKAAQFLALNRHLQGYYDTLKLRSRRAARRIMRIGRDYGPGAAKEAFAACLELTKDEESARRALVKARQENEQLRALLKANRITVPKL
jgi:hypothetical protein